MDEAIKITRLHPDMWQDFKSIRLEALSSDPSAFQDSFTNALSYPDDFWSKRLSDPHTIILTAKTDTHTVGMISGHLKEEPDGILTVVTGVYVNKSYRGMGVAKRLMATLIDTVKHHKKTHKMKLWVNKNQHPAIALYKSFKFKQSGIKEDAIETEDGYVDEIIMEKHL